jgi:hypothetical protein
MSQHSEDRLSAPMEPRLSTARILPFERPQSELQKALQLRAHEDMELSRRRLSQRPPLIRWMIGIVGAAVPVVILVMGLDGFLRMFHHITDMYAKMPVPAAPVVAEAPSQSQPGLVMLKSVESEAPPAAASPLVPPKQ